MSPLGVFVLAASLWGPIEVPSQQTLDCGLAVFQVELFCGCQRTRLTRRSYVARRCDWGAE